MEIYELSPDGGVKRIEKLPEAIRLVCAFGCFDGVHVGHQRLLSETVERAERLSSATSEGGVGYASAVWTFSEPASRDWIVSVSERLSLFGRYGIRYALCQRFEEVRTLSPEGFVYGLSSDYGLRWGVCGYNFRFGYKGEGNAERLGVCINAALGRLGESVPRTVDGAPCGVTVVGEVRALGGAVSSTRIRALLSEGDMESVSVLLGRPYSLSGEVTAGKRLGRTISRPTVNLLFASDQLVPRRGVYFTYCRVRGGVYRAVTNVGYRPTVNSDERSITCEAHLLDFSDSVYGEQVEIIFVHYHRGEAAFASVEELSRRISDDVACAVEFFDGKEEA